MLRLRAVDSLDDLPDHFLLLRRKCSAALLLPLSYKFNSVNARSWLFLLIAGIVGLGGLLIAILPAELRGGFITLLNNTDEASALLMLAALFAVMLLVYGISYRVCVRIYEKKEY